MHLNYESSIGYSGTFDMHFNKTAPERQRLIGFICRVRSLDFGFGRRDELDVEISNPKIHMPVELGLTLIANVGSDGIDT